MATVVNMHKDPNNLGGALGEGMSAGLVKHFEKEIKKEQAGVFAAAVNPIRNAETEDELNKALIAAMNSNAVEDRDDVAALSQLAQQRRKEIEPVPIQAIDTNTNQKVTRFVPGHRAKELNTPEGQAKHLGLGFRMGEPEDEVAMFLAPGQGESTEPPDDFQYLGKMPLSKRPAGAVVSEEYDLIQAQLKAKRDAAAAGRAERREDIALGVQERLARTEKAGITERAVDNLRQEQAALSRLAGTSMGGSLNLETGDLTFGDVNQRKRWNAVVKTGSRLLRSGKAKDAAEALEQAEAAHPEKDFKPQIEVDDKADDKKKEPEKAGAFSIQGIADKVKRFFSGDKDKEPTEKELVEAVPGWKYEPKKYDYRVGPGGKLQRSPKK